jgi:hypothetical protein
VGAKGSGGMKISKWVEMSEEVEIEIGADDIRVALAEAFDKMPRYGLCRARI